MSTSHVRDELTVVRQVRRSKTMQRLVNKHHQFEINSLFHRQPVELSQHRSDMNDHAGKHQWRAVPPRSVLTVAAELDRQRCRTATRYSSPVDMTRTTELTSSWRHPTANASDSFSFFFSSNAHSSDLSNVVVFIIISSINQSCSFNGKVWHTAN